MDALRAAAGDADVGTLSGGEVRRVALCRLLLAEARPPAARRAHEPPRRGVGGLARALPQGVPGHGRRDHPRPVLPRQRRGLDPRAGPRRGHPLGGQLHLLARAEAAAAGRRRRSRKRRGSARSSASSSGCGCRPRARQAKSKARLARLRAAARRGPASERDGTGRDHHPAGSAPRATSWCEAEELAQGLRRPAAHRGPHLQPAARRHRRRHRPERRGQDDAVPHDHRPGEARQRRAARRRDGEPVLRGPEPRHPRSDQERLGGDLGRRRSSSSSAPGRSPRAPTSPRSTSRAPTSRSGWATSRAASATALHLATMLKSGGNLLLLDEPTNDLDVDTLRALEDALLAFAGLRRGHQPRPLVPRPDRHPHARLRGREPGGLVRGQLRGLRGRPARSASAPTPSSRTASATSRSRAADARRARRCGGGPSVNRSVREEEPNEFLEGEGADPIVADRLPHQARDESGDADRAEPAPGRGLRRAAEPLLLRDGRPDACHQQEEDAARGRETSPR